MRHDRFDMKSAEYVLKLRVERFRRSWAGSSSADAAHLWAVCYGL
jgi:hypothetical protein